MASLRRTVALEEVHGVAVVVAEDLHLDMARRRQAALQQDMLVAERGLGLAARRLQRFEEIVLARHHSHALAAAAGGSLDHQRSEEHTSELQSLMRNSYAVFCLKKKNTATNRHKPS